MNSEREAINRCKVLLLQLEGLLLVILKHAMRGYSSSLVSLFSISKIERKIYLFL